MYSKNQTYSSRVVFGKNSAPMESQFVAQENAQRNQDHYSLATETVLKSTYMDDSIDSVENDDEGMELYRQWKALKWMLLNNLRLNNDKTELLVLHAKHRPKPPLDSITVGDATVEPTSGARNIGAIFDETMSFEEHVDDLCKTAFYHIRNSRIRPRLSIDSTKTLVHVLVMSR